jgi:hypothetical protein
LFGPRAHGKTVFSLGLWRALQNLGNFLPIVSSTVHGRQSEVATLGERLFHEGVLPPATVAGVLPRPMLLTLHDLPGGKSTTLVIFDLPGELSALEEISAHVPFLSRVDPVWLFYSPGEDDGGPGRVTLDHLLDTYVKSMHGQGHEVSGRRLTVVYTKAERNPDLPPDVRAYLLADPFAVGSPVRDFSLTEYARRALAVSTRLEAFTRMCIPNGGNFLNRAARVGIRPLFCVSSGLGEAPVRTGSLTALSPLRLLDPLLLALALEHSPRLGEADRPSRWSGFLSWLSGFRSRRHSSQPATVASVPSLPATPQVRRPSCLFISHSHHDREFVESALLPGLRERGIGVWYSPASIRTAEDWHHSVLQGLQQCDWFLVVLSEQSIVSRWVQSEIMYAVQHLWGRIVPVVIEPCDPRTANLQLCLIQQIDCTAPSTPPEHALRKVLAVWGLE